MDRPTGLKSPQQVDAVLQTIKARMPRTYASIQTKAGEIGRQAYAMVRRSIAGEANLFWAMEAGHIVGTPFSSEHPIAADVAQAMVTTSCSRVTVWGKPADAPPQEGGA